MYTGIVATSVFVILQAYSQVMLAQQQTITQLLDMVHKAGASLSELVKARVTGQAINDLKSHEESKQMALKTERSVQGRADTEMLIVMQPLI